MPKVHWHELLSKRMTGYVNWQRHRQHFHQIDILNGLMAHIKAKSPDHIAITGDLVNIATRAEIDQAKLWLQAHADPDKTSLVPGNHDAYIPGAAKKSADAWQDWMSGERPLGANHFPYVRRKGPIAIIGLTTSNATLPFRATGNFRQKQAQAAATLLRRAKDDGLFRIILIHHPPYPKATHPMKRMIGIGNFSHMIKAEGAELILHGHTHYNTTHLAQFRNKTIPIIGISSASQAAGDQKPVAGFNLFEIKKVNSDWSLDHQRFAMNVQSNQVDLIEQNQF